MSSNQGLIDSLTTRQIFIERYAKGESKKLLKHLNRLSEQLKELVESEYDRLSAVKLAKKVSILSKQILTEYGDELSKDLTDFAVAEAAFAGQAIIASTSATRFNKPARAVIESVLTSRKMELLTGDVIRRLTIGEASKSFSKNKAKEIARIIRDGATVGRTSQEIVSEITERVSVRTKQQAESLVRTATNHMGGQARQAVYSANDDIITGERYVATLDSRTTVTCASLDGQVFAVGEGPKTPHHWGCRSVRVPVINPKYNLGSDITGERASIDGQY